MNKVEEIESVIARLPSEDFEKLADWINARAQSLSAQPKISRDHSAFLNSYAPSDEGLYDDAPAR